MLVYRILLLRLGSGYPSFLCLFWICLGQSSTLRLRSRFFLEHERMILLTPAYSNLLVDVLDIVNKLIHLITFFFSPKHSYDLFV